MARAARRMAVFCQAWRRACATVRPFRALRRRLASRRGPGWRGHVATQNGFVVWGAPMASPQDSPTRKKQKIRARRKLAEWRKKQEASSAAEPAKATK